MSRRSSPAAPGHAHGSAARREGRAPWAVLVVRAAAGALGAWALAETLWYGVEQPGAALAFGLLIAVGEFARWGPAVPREAAPREAAPLGSAGALAYALLGDLGTASSSHGVGQVLAVVLAAGLAGTAPHIGPDAGPALDHLARRVLTVCFTAVCFQPLYNSGLLAEWIGEGPFYALFLLFLLVLTALCDAVLAAALARSRTGWPYGPLLRDELHALLGIGSAICATGAVMALAVAAAGLWALPVFSVPLLLTQFSFRRYNAVRATYRQTITSLARATEVAGHTPAGHARRVAALSRAVGRELGLSEAELTVLEYAALMHDIGQLSLLDPVPAGATEPLPRAEQLRIARLGGEVVRQTGVPAEVAEVVERQADPYRDQPLAARIVRAANAYDDLAGGAGWPEDGRPGGGRPAAGRLGGPLAALERLRLATASDYEPRVVEALARVLSRGGPLP